MSKGLEKKISDFIKANIEIGATFLTEDINVGESDRTTGCYIRGLKNVAQETEKLHGLVAVWRRVS